MYGNAVCVRDGLGYITNITHDSTFTVPTSVINTLNQSEISGLTGAPVAVFQLVTQGKCVSNEAGSALLTALGGVARIREVDELACRLSNLEEALSTGGGGPSEFNIRFVREPPRGVHENQPLANIPLREAPSELTFPG
jgi:hypothetical protein